MGRPCPPAVQDGQLFVRDGQLFVRDGQLFVRGSWTAGRNISGRRRDSRERPLQDGGLRLRQEQRHLRDQDVSLSALHGVGAPDRSMSRL
jgi:hypothetical protein